MIFIVINSSVLHPKANFNIKLYGTLQNIIVQITYLYIFENFFSVVFTIIPDKSLIINVQFTAKGWNARPVN